MPPSAHMKRVTSAPAKTWNSKRKAFAQSKEVDYSSCVGVSPRGRKTRRPIFYDHRRRIALERRRKRLQITVTTVTRTLPHSDCAKDHFIDIEGDGPEPSLHCPSGLVNGGHHPLESSRFGGSSIPIPSFRRLGTISLANTAHGRTKKTGGEARLRHEMRDEIYLQRHRTLETAERRARKREAELDRYKTYIAKLKRESPELWTGR